jgi:hypothetical protein
VRIEISCVECFVSAIFVRTTVICDRGSTRTHVGLSSPIELTRESERD